MTTQYLGQIEAFAFNFAPKGWAQCNGQLLSIQQNAALFALLGTYYGGNGTTTFQLPDLRGRIAVSQGTAPSGTSYTIGELLGTENVTVLVGDMPSHSHAMNVVNNSGGGTEIPSGSVQLGVASERGGATTPLYAAASGSLVAMENLGSAGASLPHPNVMPYLTINYCISLTGIFPSRG